MICHKLTGAPPYDPFIILYQGDVGFETVFALYAFLKDTWLWPTVRIYIVNIKNYFRKSACYSYNHHYVCKYTFGYLRHEAGKFSVDLYSIQDFYARQKIKKFFRRFANGSALFFPLPVLLTTAAVD